VSVEVEKGDLLPGSGVAGDSPDPDGAVPAQDQRLLASLPGLAHPSGGIGHDLDHGVRVLGPSVHAIWSPPPELAVAVLAHIGSGALERFDQPASRSAAGARS
jgi:hypothetical protein